jgi:cobalt-zinc-cadmium efflux system membrane fusion protein
MMDVVSFFRNLDRRIWLAFGAGIIAAVVAVTLHGEPGTAQSAAAEPKAEAAHNEALMTTSQVLAAGISIETAAPATIAETVTLYGTIKTNAERQQDLRARYPGVVRAVTKRPGESAAKGETLLTVEANESLQTYAIHSPITGHVLERNVNPGQSVSADAILMKVADLGTVWAEFAVFTRELGRVRAGLPVRVTGTDNGPFVEATASYVASTGDGDSQSVVGRAVLDNASGKWIPGQFVTADVAITQVAAAVAVKPAALQEINGKIVVFVQTQRGFVARAVSVGKRSREAVEIIQGLAVGEHYAVVNSYLIKADLTKGEAEEE